MSATVPIEIRRASAVLWVTVCASGLVLSSVASAGIVSPDAVPAPVAKRIKWLEKAKQTNPEVFVRVEPYYEGVIHIIPAVVHREVVTLKPFSLDVLHPKYRDAIEAHPEAYAAIQSAFDRAKEKAEEGRPHSDVARMAWEEYEVEVREIFAESQIPSKVFRLLTGAVRTTQIEELDPVTLPAWEAGLVDPQVTWAVKGLLVDVVARFEDPGSTPILGWLGREAMRRSQEVCPAEGARTEKGRAPKPSRECENVRSVWIHLSTAFSHHPRKDTALELSAFLQEVERPQSTQQWASALAESREWMDVLRKLERDPDTAGAIEPLMAAVRAARSEKEQDEE